MSSIKKYNVFICEPDYTIKLIGEYLDHDEAMTLFWSSQGNIGICEVTGDYLNEIRKEKIERLNEYEKN